MIPQELLNKILSDRAIRSEVTRQNHYVFFNVYFSRYVRFATADFQRDIFELTQDQTIERLFLMAFRGSGKSTIITTSYPIWAILGMQKKKFILIVAQTRAQAKQHMMNIKSELEDNELLRNDLGPFHEESDEWGVHTLVFSEHNARISIASTEQSVRGLRHHQHRPDLIICDDLEDLASCKTMESRDRTYQWFTSEILPIGDLGTRIIVIGNLLHQDSLLMKIKQKIEDGNFLGTFREYPLINGKRECLWPSKFKNSGELEKFRLSIGSEVAWQREYLMRIMPTEDQVVFQEWVKHYDELPDRKDELHRYRYAAIGVDLAISKKDDADFTAIVSAWVYNFNKDFRIYILPHPVNEKMSFPDALEKIKSISDTIEVRKKAKIYVESVGYQMSVAQQLEKEHYPAEGISVHGQDKRSRLALTTPHIQSGTIVFPRMGCEKLIQQLVGFGSEKHDDLVDAFSLLIGQILSKTNTKGNFEDVFVGGTPRDDIWNGPRITWDTQF